MNFLIWHVKLAGDSAKDFLSTSSSIIHVGRCLVSGANAAFCRDITRFATSALVAFFPIAHLGGCWKERPFIVSFLTPHDDKKCFSVHLLWSMGHVAHYIFLFRKATVLRWKQVVVYWNRHPKQFLNSPCFRSTGMYILRYS